MGWLGKDAGQGKKVMAVPVGHIGQKRVAWPKPSDAKCAGRLYNVFFFSMAKPAL